MLNQNRPAGTGKEVWLNSIREQLKPPRIMVKNFGGGIVNVIYQCTVSLASGDSRRNVTVLVQKGVPQKLLLGTDVLKDLGFHLLGPAIGRACMTDLLGTGSWQM